ncbi:HtaA domain-containing protein [Glaciibacter sp. 2TAF33]|uniref:HtaA domain-containing protein n=1 Tax=Glaciibacter sp. 2TAF33 TaxID=3233015 RepID=UPI003F9197A0
MRNDEHPPTSTGETSGMVWRIRSSFIRYVTGSGGVIGIRGRAGTVKTPAGVAFYFGLDDASGFDPMTLSGTLAFSGAVDFTAHGGMLSLSIVDPWIIFGERSLISVLFGDQRVPLAQVTASPPTFSPGSGGVLEWSALPTHLEATAVPLFGDVYTAGVAMDPISVRIEASRVVATD